MSSANGKTMICSRNLHWDRHTSRIQNSSCGTVQIPDCFLPWSGQAKTDAVKTSHEFWGISLSASCPKASWLKFEETSAGANLIRSQDNYRNKGIAVDWLGGELCDSEKTEKPFLSAKKPSRGVNSAWWLLQPPDGFCRSYTWQAARPFFKMKSLRFIVHFWLVASVKAAPALVGGAGYV